MVWQNLRLSAVLKTGVLIVISTLVLLLLLDRTVDRLIPGFAGRDEVFFVAQSLIMLGFSVGFLQRLGYINIRRLKPFLTTHLNSGIKTGISYSALYFALLALLGAVLASLVILSAKTSGVTVADIIKNSGGSPAFPQAVLESKWRMFMYFTGFCFMVPVAEELFFRGLLYESLKSKFKPKAAAVLSAFIFAAGHINNFAMSFISGLYLAFVYEKGRNLTAAIIVHSTINIAALLVMIFL